MEGNLQIAQLSFRKAGSVYFFQPEGGAEKPGLPNLLSNRIRVVLPGPGKSEQIHQTLESRVVVAVFGCKDCIPHNDSGCPSRGG